MARATGRPHGRPPQISEGTSLQTGGLENIPDSPEHLNEDGIGMWYSAWQAIGDYSEEGDGLIITELCEAFQEKELYRRSLDQGVVPRTYTLTNKTVVRHPYTVLLSEARARLTALLSALGLSPADRARLGMLQEETNNEIMELLKRRRERQEERENHG